MVNQAVRSERWYKRRNGSFPRGAMFEGEAGSEQPRLRRVMGPGVLLLFIVGDILGTGVYALIGDVAAEVGGAA
jgi:hypothetical protein